MKIIDRLPFGERPHIVSVGHDRVDVHRNQIIVWISIGNVLSPFPAILSRPAEELQYQGLSG